MGSKYVKWDITSRCNLRCAHCSVGDRYLTEGTAELPIQHKLEIVEKLADAGVEAVSLLGGEPLMVGRDLLTLVNHAVSRGLKISVVTNGLLLSGRFMEELVDLGPDRLVVSLEGASKENHEAIRGENTYDRVIRNVSALTGHLRRRSFATQVNINTVLNRLNCSETDRLLDLCLSLGVNEWTGLSLVDAGFAQDNLDALVLTPEQEIEVAAQIARRCSPNSSLGDLKVNAQVYPLVWDYVARVYNLQMPKSRACCNASTSLGFIQPDGNLYPCDRIATAQYVGTEIGGSRIRPMSLLEHDFYEIWNSDYYLDMFELILKDETYSGFSPCCRCGYLKTRFCNPCPLYSLHGKVRIASCLIAEQRLGDISGPSDQLSYLDSLLVPAPRPESATPSVDNGLIPRTAHRVPARRSGVRSVERADGLVLLNPYTAEFVGLNVIGKLVWDSIDGIRTVGEATTVLHEAVAEVLDALPIEVHQEDLQLKLATEMCHFFERLHNLDLILWV